MPIKYLEISPDLAKIKADEDESGADAGYVEGYASVFGNVDHGRDIVEKGAFTKTLKEHLPKGMVKLYDSHLVRNGTKSIIGIVEEAKEDDYGLWFKARFSKTADAQDVRTKIKEKILNALSFGYEVMKSAPDAAKKANRLLELKMYEISVVPWGMNPKALIEGVKGEAPELENPEPEVPETIDPNQATPEQIKAFLDSLRGAGAELKAKSLLEEMRAYKARL